MKTVDELIADHERKLRALRKRHKEDEARLATERRVAQHARMAAVLAVDPEDLDAMDTAIASIEVAYARRAAANAAPDGYATHADKAQLRSGSDEIGA